MTRCLEVPAANCDEMIGFIYRLMEWSVAVVSFSILGPLQFVRDSG